MTVASAPAATRPVASILPGELLRGPYGSAMLANFFFFASLNGFMLLPLHIHRLGGDAADVGLVQGMYSAAGIASQPFIGLIVDRVGRRFFMVLGVSLLLGSCLAFVVSSSFVLFGALRAVQGLAFSTFFIASYVHIVDLVPPERRGWALGFFGLAGLGASALAPRVGEAVIRHASFAAWFAMDALIAAGALVLVARDRHILPPQAGVGPSVVETIRNWRREIRRMHTTLGFFFGLGTGTIFTFMPTFSEGLGVRGLGLFYTAYSGGAIVVRLFGGELIDRLGRRAVIVPSLLVQALAAGMLASLALLLPPSSSIRLLPFLVVVGLLAGSAHGFLYPALSALLVDVTPPPRRASAVGIFSAATLLGNAVGAVVFGYVTHGLGYRWTWTGLAVLLAIGTMVSLRLRRRAPAAPAPERSVG
jgi:MFS family permease